MHNASVEVLHTASVEQLALIILLVVAILLVTPFATIIVMRRTNSLRPNFRGEHIPAMFGLSIIVSSILLLALSTGRSEYAKDIVLRWIVLVLCFGTLGFIDDKWGDKQVKGLRGHLRAAFKDHRVTSGLIKAIGGVISGLLIGRWANPGSLAHAATAGLLIALCANGVNLLDLRPGRACAVFLLCSTALLAAALSTPLPKEGELLLICVLLPTLPAWILDSRAKVMLGDTGSNVLGASLGLALAESHLLTLQLAAIALLIALHILAERRSITQIIANNKLLNTLDNLTGIRE